MAATFAEVPPHRRPGAGCIWRSWSTGCPRRAADPQAALDEGAPASPQPRKPTASPADAQWDPVLAALRTAVTDPDPATRDAGAQALDQCPDCLRGMRRTGRR